MRLTTAQGGLEMGSNDSPGEGGKIRSARKKKIVRSASFGNTVSGDKKRISREMCFGEQSARGDVRPLERKGRSSTRKKTLKC